MDSEKLKQMAMDLTLEFPRSPRELLGGYVIVARCLDKCRSSLAGKSGAYKFWPCSLCKFLTTFTGIDREAFSDFVATGASDEAVGEWVKSRSQVKSPMEIIRWNNKMRDMRISELPDELQVHLETDMQSLPKHRPAYVWFDIFDLEEGRL